MNNLKIDTKLTMKEKAQRILLLLIVIIFLVLIIVMPGNILLMSIFILTLFGLLLVLKYPSNEVTLKKYILGYFILFTSLILICGYTYNLIDFFKGGSVSGEYIITDINKGKGGSISSIEVQDIQNGNSNTLYLQLLSNGERYLKKDKKVYVNSTLLKNVVEIKPLEFDKN